MRGNGIWLRRNGYNLITTSNRLLFSEIREMSRSLGNIVWSTLTLIGYGVALLRLHVLERSVYVSVANLPYFMKKYGCHLPFDATFTILISKNFPGFFFSFLGKTDFLHFFKSLLRKYYAIQLHTTFRIDFFSKIHLCIVSVSKRYH